MMTRGNKELQHLLRMCLLTQYTYSLRAISQAFLEVGDNATKHWNDFLSWPLCDYLGTFDIISSS